MADLDLVSALSPCKAFPLYICKKMPPHGAKVDIVGLAILLSDDNKVATIQNLSHAHIFYPLFNAQPI